MSVRIYLEVYLPFRGQRSFWKGEEEVPKRLTPVSLLTHLGLDVHPELTVIVNGRLAADDASFNEGDNVAILRAAEGGGE